MNEKDRLKGTEANEQLGKMEGGKWERMYNELWEQMYNYGILGKVGLIGGVVGETGENKGVLSGVSYMPPSGGYSGWYEENEGRGDSDSINRKKELGIIGDNISFNEPLKEMDKISEGLKKQANLIYGDFGKDEEDMDGPNSAFDVFSDRDGEKGSNVIVGNFGSGVSVMSEEKKSLRERMAERLEESERKRRDEEAKGENEAFGKLFCEPEEKVSDKKDKGVDQLKEEFKFKLKWEDYDMKKEEKALKGIIDLFVERVANGVIEGIGRKLNLIGGSIGK